MSDERKITLTIVERAVIVAVLMHSGYESLANRIADHFENSDTDTANDGPEVEILSGDTLSQEGWDG